MPHFQTCHCHPEAGRFLVECYGCKRELFDVQQRNETEADARKALVSYGMPNAVVLSAKRIGTALVVASEQPNSYLPYCVDTFRPPTGDELDPEQDDPRKPGDWVLIDQCGDHLHDQVDTMIADASRYVVQLGLNV